MLDSQLAVQFKDSPECLPKPYMLHPLHESLTPFEIPSTMVPPEDFDFGASADDSTHRRIMMPRILLRFSDAEVCTHFPHHSLPF